MRKYTAGYCVGQNADGQDVFIGRTKVPPAITVWNFGIVHVDRLGYMRHEFRGTRKTKAQAVAAAMTLCVATYA